MKKKNFFYKKINSILKLSKRNQLAVTTEHKALVFFYKRGKHFNNKEILRNIQIPCNYRRKTIMYIQPFFIDQIFFSKLFSAKLIKRLANVW